MAAAMKQLLHKVQRAASVDDLGPLWQQLENNAAFIAVNNQNPASAEAAVQQGLLGALQRACELVAGAGLAGTPLEAGTCACLWRLVDIMTEVCASLLTSATFQLIQQQLQSGLMDAFAAACSAVADALSNQQEQQQQQLPLLAAGLLDAWSCILLLWDTEDQWQAYCTVLLPSIAPVAGLAVVVLRHSSRASSSRSSARQANLQASEVTAQVAHTALRAAAGVCGFAVMAHGKCVVLRLAAHPALPALQSPQVQLLTACITALLAQHTHQQQQGRAAGLRSPAASSSSRARSSSRGKSGSAAGHSRAGSSSRAASNSSASQGSAPPKHHELLLSLTGLTGLQQRLGEEPPMLLPVHAQLMAVSSLACVAVPVALNSSSTTSSSSSSAASPEPPNGLVAPLLLPLALTVCELLLLEPPSSGLLSTALGAIDVVLQRWQQHQKQSAAAAAAGGPAEQASAHDGAAAAAESGAMQQLLQLFQMLTLQQMASVADQAEWQRVIVLYGSLLADVCQSANDLEGWTDAGAAAWEQAIASGSSALEAAVRALAAQQPEGGAAAADPIQRIIHASGLARSCSLCGFVVRRCSSAKLLVGSTGAAQAGAAQQLFCSIMKACNAHLSGADRRMPVFVLGSVTPCVQQIVAHICSRSSTSGTSGGASGSGDMSSSSSSSGGHSSSSNSSSSSSSGEPSPELLVTLGRACNTAALALRQAMAVPPVPVATDEVEQMEIFNVQLALCLQQVKSLCKVVSFVPLPQLLPAFVPANMRQQLLEQRAALAALLVVLAAGDDADAGLLLAEIAADVAASASSAAEQASRLERSGQLADALQAFAGGLCSAVPVRWCCNNPACTNLTQLSELQLVSRKGSVCSGCRSARFCSAACQKQHWTRQGHKPVCKAIQQQRQQQAAGAQGQQQQQQ